MIREIRGNLLDVREGFIAVLTNTHGEMEYGLARQVRKKFMTPESYTTMKKKCEETLESYPIHALLGRYFLRENPNGQDPIVAPMIALCETVNGKDRLLEAAMKEAMTGLREMAEKVGFRISIPGFLGCGIHGGDWERIYSKVLVPLFGESPVQLDIIYNDASVDRLVKASYDIPCDRAGCIMEGWHGFPRTTQWEEIRQWLLNTFPKKETNPTKDAFPDMPFGEVRTSGRPDKERVSPEEQKMAASMTSCLSGKGREVKGAVTEDDSNPDSLLREVMQVAIAEGIRDSISQAGFQCGNVTTGTDAIFFTAQGHNFVLTLAEESPSKEDGQAGGASADI